MEFYKLISMLILSLFAFLAGVATILSPCILPLLPIILSSSVAGGKKRPIGVVLGFILSFTFFSLALTAIVKATNLPPDLLRNISIVIILIFGLSIMIPQLQILWEKLFSKVASSAPDTQNASGFSGGLVVGVSLGLVWTPCVGPIMAAVLTLAATSSVTLEAVIITLAYSIGTAFPMLLIIIGGRSLLEKMPFLLRNTAKIQKVFGAILVVVALAIYMNLDRKFQAWILTKLPNYEVGITKLESIDAVKNRLDMLGNQDPQEETVVDANSICKSDFGAARNFEGATEWLNSDPLNLEELKGKVVLVDFWTYTCINCIRTLPYVTGWYEKYKDQGFVVVGVHTPEFEFEKKADNVLKAMKDYGINYPVVQDNDYAIWKRYKNRYWPAHYFIDKDGCVRHTHFGEGKYEESEAVIQELLSETGTLVSKDLLEIEENKKQKTTPESYLGYLRMSRFASPEALKTDVAFRYSLPNKLEKDELGFQGEWTFENERALPAAGGVIEINFSAKEVYLVMRSESNVPMSVYLDGMPIPNDVAGADVEDGKVKIMEDRLYKIVKLGDYENHILRLEFPEEGAELYAFTFG